MNWLNWQCCLAGNSKTALRILIFSIAMGADYSFELISIEIYAPQFIGHNDLFLGSVGRVCIRGSNYGILGFQSSIVFRLLKLKKCTSKKMYVKLICFYISQALLGSGLILRFVVFVPKKKSTAC